MPEARSSLSEPRKSNTPMQKLEAHSMAEVVEALRVWRDRRGITHEVFDSIAGWADGFTGKLLLRATDP